MPWLLLCVFWLHLLVLPLKKGGCPGFCEADQKPRLLIDLMFDPNQTVLPQPRVMRFSSADFDIRDLLHKATDAQTVYAQMLAGLLDRSGTVPLPERNAVLGKPYAIFDSVRALERTTYFPA